jgi:hypothetical protein
MSSKKLFAWFLGLVLVLAAVAGCQASEPEPELIAIELVPEGANLIANIQMSQIIDDRELRGAYDRTEKEPEQPRTAEEALNQFVEETGLDLRDFSEVIMFADVATLEQADYLGFIVEGTFDEQQFIDSLEKEAGEEFTTSNYKDYKLYVDKAGESGVAFLSDRMLLLGTSKAVKDAIDVSKGVRNQVSGTILDTYNQLGDALIKFAVELPEEAREALTEEPVPGDVPISLESFADIDILGLALNKEADTVTIQIKTHFLSTDSAEDTGDMLSGALILFRGTLQDPEIKELLGKIEVTVTDTWVTIAFEITLSDMEQLAETFQP